MSGAGYKSSKEEANICFDCMLQGNVCCKFMFLTFDGHNFLNPDHELYLEVETETDLGKFDPLGNKVLIVIFNITWSVI